VREEVCATGRCGRYDPKLYPEVFQRGFSQAHRELVERRLRCASDHGDPLDSLLAGVPEFVLEWFRQRSLLADGTDQAPPLTTAAILSETMAQVQVGEPAVPRRRGRPPNWSVAVHALLLRDVGGLTCQETGRHLGFGAEWARRQSLRARLAAREDPEFAARIAAIIQTALERTYPKRRGTK
jgi:hypothetical protein